MSTTVSEFRQIFLIYCLDRQPDGSYVALNRRYKPLGHTGVAWVDYAEHPAAFRFKRALSAQQIAFISYKGDTDAERIYLYADGCCPTANNAQWRTYSARLERLAGYLIEH